MIKKKVINPSRVRRIGGGFSFIPHRFLTEGFLESLNQRALLLYLFLVLASDRNGISYYAYDSICSLLQFTLDEYIEARDDLIKRDLIAFDGRFFQVLDLPEKPIRLQEIQQGPVRDNPTARLIQRSFKEACHD